MICQVNGVRVKWRGRQPGRPGWARVLASEELWHLCPEWIPGSSAWGLRGALRGPLWGAAPELCWPRACQGSTGGKLSALCAPLRSRLAPGLGAGAWSSLPLVYLFTGIANSVRPSVLSTLLAAESPHHLEEELPQVGPQYMFYIKKNSFMKI